VMLEPETITFTAAVLIIPRATIMMIAIVSVPFTVLFILNLRIIDIHNIAYRFSNFNILL